MKKGCRGVGHFVPTSHKPGGVCAAQLERNRVLPCATLTSLAARNWRLNGEAMQSLMKFMLRTFARRYWRLTLHVGWISISGGTVCCHGDFVSQLESDRY
jgi:hypothetical protein